jgi:hypothetical protein
VDFTREPVIQTVITPKEGSKLVVRSSKGSNQEEYFVDSVEVVSFGHALFYRSMEKPKSFLVPVTDYEIVEVREARLVLKHVGLDRSIKIGGGREAAMRPPKEVPLERIPEEKQETLPDEEVETGTEGKSTPRLDKKRERRRNYRRRRLRDEPGAKEEGSIAEESETSTETSVKEEARNGSKSPTSAETEAPAVVRAVIPPPPTLISETLASYRENALFSGAFYSREDAEKEGADSSSTINEDFKAPLEPPELPPATFISENTHENNDPWGTPTNKSE